MGVYGSPDLSKKEYKEVRKKSLTPQKNIWVWVAILIVNVLFFLVSDKKIGDILTLIILDSMIVFGISVVSLIVNLIRKSKIGNDIKFIGISMIVFFISAIFLGTL